MTYVKQHATPNARRSRTAKDDATAACLQMRDHRGREIKTGRNLMTFLNYICANYDTYWPEAFATNWSVQTKRRAASQDGREEDKTS
jgi:hypothetical protein